MKAKKLIAVSSLLFVYILPWFNYNVEEIPTFYAKDGFLVGGLVIATLILLVSLYKNKRVGIIIGGFILSLTALLEFIFYSYINYGGDRVDLVVAYDFANIGVYYTFLLGLLFIVLRKYIFESEAINLMKYLKSMGIIMSAVLLIGVGYMIPKNDSKEVSHSPSTYVYKDESMPSQQIILSLEDLNNKKTYYYSQGGNSSDKGEYSILDKDTYLLNNGVLKNHLVIFSEENAKVIDMNNHKIVHKKLTKKDSSSTILS